MPEITPESDDAKSADDTLAGIQGANEPGHSGEGNNSSAPTESWKKWLAIGGFVVTTIATLSVVLVRLGIVRAHDNKTDTPPTVVNNISVAPSTITTTTVQIPPVVTQASPPPSSPANIPASPPASGHLETPTNQIVSPQPGNNWPALGKNFQIEISDDLPKAGYATHYFQFYQQVQQGDRLRFHIRAVGGAAMKLQVLVFLGDDPHRFDGSRMLEGRLDWTMTKPIPGNRVRVQILGWQLGSLDVQVEKVE